MSIFKFNLLTTTMKDINQICDYIILRHKSDEDLPLSNIKLQKILYYVQAWHLAFKKEPLFNSKFQAWVHGPVNREIYGRFNATKYLYSEINLSDVIDTEVTSKLNKDEISHINLVLDAYSKYSGIDLEEMTHKEDPWIIARSGYEPNQRCEIEIDNVFLGDYFRKRIK
jgi:uncharacterized phage-associated protein